MNYDIINKTKENLDKLKQILSINELLYSAIDIVGDLTNTKMPEYKNELEKNKCFFIDMFKQGQLSNYISWYQENHDFSDKGYLAYLNTLYCIKHNSV